MVDLDHESYFVFLCSRISQDLAKDLAMLAREIHDVAGEIDSVSPSSAPTASVRRQLHHYQSHGHLLYLYGSFNSLVPAEMNINTSRKVC